MWEEQSMQNHIKGRPFKNNNQLRSIDQNNNIITSFVNPFNYTLPGT